MTFDFQQIPTVTAENWKIAKPEITVEGIPEYFASAPAWPRLVIGSTVPVVGEIEAHQGDEVCVEYTMSGSIRVQSRVDHSCLLLLRARPNSSVVTPPPPPPSFPPRGPLGMLPMQKGLQGRLVVALRKKVKLRLTTSTHTTTALTHTR